MFLWRKREWDGNEEDEFLHKEMKRETMIKEEERGRERESTVMMT